MNETNLSLSTSQKLQPFLLLSKSARGVANTKLIMDALSAPGVYVFTELYELPNVVEASNLPEVAPYYTLLSIFMYGTFKDYEESQTQLPALNEAQTRKLKQLSIATLSESQQTLPYDILQTYLNIPTVRELEDLIIDGFYQGIFTGKLDQRHGQLQVMYSMGRDLRPQQLKETINALAAWSVSTSRILGALDAKIASLQDNVRENEQAQEDYLNRVEQLRRDVRANTNLKKLDTMDESMIKKQKGFSGEYDYTNERVKKSRGSKRFMIGRP
ncbi:uncharacterized protein B0P05DRAFT_558118 [Gilbertella persicaria]|uniref:uncharacterized protein n=1 Tax=Gilbertella persicaria TaxID=101096 RepID=UPI002220016E|nr:uncharacterized protein B0P05DRAFT_558118 [Gilbertella persicaria]KAI8059917.1 hypothetical protein B0P05DRAFT_558118 [Gilbertella persicaria]